MHTVKKKGYSIESLHSDESKSRTVQWVHFKANKNNNNNNRKKEE